MISTKGLGKRYGERSLWSELDLVFNAGTMTAITGASGSGKSTLLNCLGALDAPSEGTIEVEGKNITSLSARGQRLYRRHTLGYLFQDYALIPDRTVGHNLNIAVDRSRRPQVASALQQVGLAGYENRKVHELSGGEQQRVALARVILRNPPVVLADEPTGALDAANADMVIDTLRRFAAEGASVVVATHSATVVDRSDRVINLDELAQ